MLSFLRAVSQMAATHGHDAAAPQQKLKLIKSPLVKSDDKLADEPNLSTFGDRYRDDAPEFQRHEQANMLEIFFDLFFAASYTVFSKNQSVTSSSRIAGYIGYFTVLWFTWLAVALYDVRFVTDSIFERVARAVHLGVMVGFAVVAPNFRPEENNHQGTLQAMSLILMISRLCLAAEYSSILWHVRKFKKVRSAFYAQIAVHSVAALIYLGISFHLQHHHSHVFITWYIICAAEALFSFGLGLYHDVLSFTKTHLMGRMSLLTIIILGDGIVVLAEKVVTIVKSPEAWNPLIIGIVTAGASTTYFVFLVYFDWMKSQHLPGWRQQTWAVLHFPFHLAMVLFMQGFTQFVLWSKIIDVLNNLRTDWITADVDALSRATSAAVHANISAEVTKFFAEYNPKWQDLIETINTTLDNITAIPDDFWPQLARFSATKAEADLPPLNTTEFALDVLTTLAVTMENSLFATFDVDLTQEFIDQDKNKNVTVDTMGGGFATTINNDTWDRFQLVFTYGYVASGTCLAFMTLLTIVSRLTPWKPWPVVRAIVYFLLAVGLALVTAVQVDDVTLDKYLFSPWLLPTICLVWFVVLLLTHTHSVPPLFFPRSATFAVRRKKGTGEDEC
ncbi:Low temperature requirement A [Metarhizium guizhouense ARSEF 977]|uniref:Low temperature requirement A n=1 Tax=Metarhizium guizhouense (strain ARSEF 977) TaxID=1276136 RepID=A0A0B4HT45_METGA|nr:Low temperature requirement A [Metarhizium guizhouense ARSEF 977]